MVQIPGQPEAPAMNKKSMDMMMRFLSLICLVVMLSGCTIPVIWEKSEAWKEMEARENARLTNMPGLKISVLEEIYGKPATTIPLATGETGYTWENFSSESIPEEDRRPYKAPDSFGGKALDFLLDREPDTFITHYCKLDVVTRDGIVVKAETKNYDDVLTCNNFYKSWYIYQAEHPERF
jgi:hypothetical protein